MRAALALESKSGEPGVATGDCAGYVAQVRRLRRLTGWILGIGIAGSFALVLPLRFLDPPTTSILLQRTVSRWISGARPVHPERRVVPPQAISAHLRRAVLAAEDDRFYLHRGFDFEEIRNALEWDRRGRALRGASTITQQTAKNLFLWEGRSWTRKAIEAWFAIVLELCLDKDRILDLYLNLAEWGDGVFGAEAAARYHFEKSAAQLGREEAARLAAILPAPRSWSPRGSVASRRARAILARMRYPAPR